MKVPNSLSFLNKKVASVILATLIGVSASATSNDDFYDDFDNFLDTDHLTLRLQFDLTHSSNQGKYIGWGPGGSIGVGYYAPIGKYTYFNGTAMFSYNTFGFDGNIENKYRPTVIDGNMYTVGLKLPLDFGFKFIDNRNIRLSLYTGPRLYFNFSVKAKYDKTTVDNYTSYEYFEKVDEKIDNSGMEIGWSGGIAVDLHKHWHAYVEYNQGLSNLGTTQTFRLEYFDFKRGEISVGVGYNF